MENKVGDNTPATSEIAKLVKQLEDVQGKLGKFCISLLPEQRQSLTRARRGIEEHLITIADLAKRYSLSLPDASPDGILNDLRTDRDLATIEQTLQVMLDLVRDTRAQAKSESSEAGYMYYGMLQGIGDRIPEVKARLKTITEFLATGPRRKPKTDPSKPE
jgi:hypothetical protein